MFTFYLFGNDYLVGAVFRRETGRGQKVLIFFAVQDIFVVVQEFKTVVQDIFVAMQEFKTIVQDIFIGMQEFKSVVQDIFVAVQEFISVVQDIFMAVQDFKSVVQDIFMTVQDFKSVVQDIFMTMQDFKSVVQDFIGHYPKSVFKGGNHRVEQSKEHSVTRSFLVIKLVAGWNKREALK